MRRIYFDNAATSFPKPAGVHEAMLRYATELGATSGRGAYREAVEGARVIRCCRERINALIGGESPDHVVFTLNATDALNLAIKGVLRAAGRHGGGPVHAVTSELDHNSVLRPLRSLEHEGVEWTCIRCDPSTGALDLDELRRELRPGTALVALAHASNVAGVVQPAAEVGAICRGRDVLFLLDGAQSLGHIPVDVGALSVDLLAFPGHKGLLGPLGTGGLYIRPGVEGRVAPLREGGTGSRSELDVQPEFMPDRYEAGSQNAIGIAGLSEGVAFILGRGEEHWRHERELVARMLGGLGEIGESAGLRLLGPRRAGERIGVFSLTHPSIDPRELAAVLEESYGILVRAGLHCAPRAHGRLGTMGRGGAVRLSVGPYLTGEDIEAACAALAGACGALG